MDHPAKRLCTISSLVMIFLFLNASGFSQSPTIERVNFIQVSESGFQMSFPFAGGMDQPQFNEYDLDGDGTQDLLVFDRAGYEIIPFLNGGTANTVDYDFAPRYEEEFPDELAHYAVFRDFNCDGKPDIFTNNGDFIRVYENVSTGSTFAFNIWSDTLMQDNSSTIAPIIVSSFDVPGIEDIDDDGDYDILTFDPAGNFLYWEKNLSMENTGNCNGMEFTRADACWGKFQESAQGSGISMNITCRVAIPGSIHNPQTGSVHAGSTVAIFDEDGDGIKDIVLGDLTSNSLTYLHNGGTLGNALIDNVHTSFPNYDTPAILDNFPGAYFLDVNNDGMKDMIVAPNSTAATFNFQNVWYYQNVSTTGGVQVSQTSTKFLQKDMIDLGTCSYPTFFDFNNDGLKDLLVGNYNTKTSVGTTSATSGLALFENVGTSSLPAFELITRDYENISTIFGSNLYGFTPAVGDMDNDGDMDLMIGDADGELHYFENIAPTGQNADFVLAGSNYKGIDVGNFSAPSIVDIDRDGKMDLVVGEMGGTLNYFHNTGTASVPDFTSSPTDNNWGGIDVSPICCTGWSVPTVFENPATGRYDLLVGSEDVDIMYYEDIESELGGNFTLDDPQFGNIREGARTSIAAADLNGDNKPEYITGNLRGGLGFYAEQGTYVGRTVAGKPAPAFDIYPNPSEGSLRLLSKARPGTDLEVDIYDIHGRRVLHNKEIYRGASMDIEVGNIPSGLYFIHVIAEGESLGTRKWVLK